MKAALIIDNTEAQELYQLAEILVKLRYYTKRWEEVYGPDAKDKKKLWEAKADQWITEHVKEIE